MVLSELPESTDFWTVLAESRIQNRLPTCSCTNIHKEPINYSSMDLPYAYTYEETMSVTHAVIEYGTNTELHSNFTIPYRLW